MYSRLSKKLQGSPTAGQVLQEIVQVILGSITDKSQLTVFDKTASEIINAASPNWELVYPLSLTATTNVYILRSQCVTTSKFKYARFMLSGSAANEPFVEPAGGTAAVYSKPAAATTYISMNSCISVNTSSGAVVNPTFFQNGLSNISLSGNADIYLSASNRHLMMYSDSAFNAACCAYGIFEFPENTVTTAKNLIPVISYRGLFSALTASTLGLQATAGSYSVCQLPDGYTTSTNTSNTILSLDNASSNISNFDMHSTWSSSLDGSDRLPLGTGPRKIIARDLFFYDIQRSMSFGNASILSKVYFGGSYNANLRLGSEMTFNGKTYIVLTGSSRFLLIPKE